MKRKAFLKAAGALGLTSILPVGKSSAAISKLAKQELISGGGCILIPQETAGPYPIDLSTNASMFRQDVTEGNPGTPVTLTLTVVNINDNCSPVQNARVDIWQTNKDGYYSGFNNQPGYLGTGNFAGQTFFRGIQLTDVNGQVQFETVYPGWYPGRVTHIHFQVFLNSVLSATSQMAFPDALNTVVYNTALYSAHGQNPTTNSSDGVFSDTSNTQYQTLTINANTSGGYDASLLVGIAAPTTGIINLEPETGGQFRLLQNYPNPFAEETIIAFKLHNRSTVKIDIYNMSGQKLFELFKGELSAGNYEVTLNRTEKGNLSAGNFVYELTVENENGHFSQCKVLRTL
jgi:protocatechuate 3,4-dioxygenase beta subunit